MVLVCACSVADIFRTTGSRSHLDDRLGTSRNIGDTHVDNRVEVETAGAPSFCTTSAKRSDTLPTSGCGDSIRREGVFYMKKARIRTVTFLASLAAFLLTSGAGFGAK